MACAGELLFVVWRRTQVTEGKYIGGEYAGEQ